MCHFIVNSLRAAWIRVGVAIVVAGDRVARALGGNIFFLQTFIPCHHYWICAEKFGA